jgi:AcrR family transcriptional regulator
VSRIVDTVRTKEKKSVIRDPVQTRGKKTKQRLVSVGKDLFSQRGYHNITADEISHAAGVSVGTFYAYFTDKRDLFLAVLDSYLEKCNGIISEGIEALSTTGGQDISVLVMKVLRLILAVHKQSPRFLKEVLKMAFADEEVKRRLDDMDRGIKNLFREALIYMGVEGKKASALAFIAYHASDGIIHEIALGESKVDEDEILLELTHLFTTYLDTHNR